MPYNPISSNICFKTGYPVIGVIKGLVPCRISGRIIPKIKIYLLSLDKNKFSSQIEGKSSIRLYKRVVRIKKLSHPIIIWVAIR